MPVDRWPFPQPNSLSILFGNVEFDIWQGLRLYIQRPIAYNADGILTVFKHLSRKEAGRADFLSCDVCDTQSAGLPALNTTYVAKTLICRAVRVT